MLRRCSFLTYNSNNHKNKRIAVPWINNEKVTFLRNIYRKYTKSTSISQGVQLITSKLMYHSKAVNLDGLLVMSEHIGFSFDSYITNFTIERAIIWALADFKPEWVMQWDLNAYLLLKFDLLQTSQTRPTICFLVLLVDGEASGVT